MRITRFRARRIARKRNLRSPIGSIAWSCKPYPSRAQVGNTALAVSRQRDGARAVQAPTVADRRPTSGQANFGRHREIREATSPCITDDVIFVMHSLPHGSPNSGLLFTLAQYSAIVFDS